MTSIISTNNAIEHNYTTQNLNGLSITMAKPMWKTSVKSTKMSRLLISWCDHRGGSTVPIPSKPLSVYLTLWHCTIPEDCSKRHSANMSNLLLGRLLQTASCGLSPVIKSISYKWMTLGSVLALCSCLSPTDAIYSTTPLEWTAIFSLLAFVSKDYW